MSSDDRIERSNLPIPDLVHVGLTTYDAKDPDTKFPPIVTSFAKRSSRARRTWA